MKWSIFLLAVISPAIIACGAADSFYLTSENGDQLGPFDFKEGSTVTIGSKTLTIAKVTTAKQKAEEILKNIMVPEVDFRNTNLQDAVDVLNKALTSSQSSRTGARNSSPVPTILPPMLSEKQKEARITFSARNISVLEALKVCVNLSKTRLRIGENTVQVVDPADRGSDPIITRYYNVLEFNEINESDLKSFFGGLGVLWPEGSSIRYIKSIGQLVLNNTEENLRQFEQALEVLNVQPTQIEIEVQFVEFDLSDVATVSQNGIISAEGLNSLQKKGKGKLLHAPKVVAKAGQEATIKAVKEIIYPTLFNAFPTVITNISNTVSNDADTRATSEVGPGNFETREVGVILTVTPNTDPTGSMLDLTVAPEIVAEPEWKDYSFTYTDLNGNERKGHVEQPFFHCKKLSTSVSVKNGSTVLIGGGMSGKDPTKVTYAFLTARLIGIDGKPIARKTD